MADHSNGTPPPHLMTTWASWSAPVSLELAQSLSKYAALPHVSLIASYTNQFLLWLYYCLCVRAGKTYIKMYCNSIENDYLGLYVKSAFIPFIYNEQLTPIALNPEINQSYMWSNWEDAFKGACLIYLTKFKIGWCERREYMQWAALVYSLQRCHSL